MAAQPPNRTMITRQHLFSAVIAALIIHPATMSVAGDWVGGISQDWTNAANWSGANTGVNVAVNLATGNFPVISSNTAAVIDTFVGSLNGLTGRVDHLAGLHSTGLHNWTFVGINGGTGIYNLANTATSGAGITGFAQGTGSLYYGDRLYIGRNGGNGTLNVNTTGTVGTGLFLVGTGSVGTVRMESGTVNAYEFVIGGNESVGNLTTGGGTATVTMSGGTWNTTNRAFIGDGANTTGTMTMTGGTWNHNNTGTLSIGLRDGNGTLVMSGTSVLNDQSVVDTSNRSTNKGNVMIGLSGTGASTGSWIMNDDAVARVRYLGVAEAANTTGMLSMNNNASLTLSQDLTVGQRGTGTVNLNGGTISLNSGYAYIGGFAGANGSLNVNGGTLKSAVAGVMRVHVAYGGTGSLTVGGGILEGLNSLLVSVLAGSVGTVQLNGGIVQSGGFSIGAGTANVNFNGGTLQATVNNANYFSGHTSSNSELQAGGLIFDSNGRNVTASNSFDGIGGITKLGTGTLSLSGINTYTGTTTVSVGALQVGSSGTGTTGTGAVTVQTGSTILGTGIVKGSSFTAQSGATIYAGDSTASSSHGTLTFTPVTTGIYDVQSGSSVILGTSTATTTDATFGGNALGSASYNTWLDAISGVGSHDRLVFNGTTGSTLAFSGNLSVIGSSYTAQLGDVFNLFDWASLVTSDFSGFASGTNYRDGSGDNGSQFDLPDISGSGFLWDISRFTNSGNIAVVIVPEPSRALLLCFGLAGVVLRRKRQA